MRGPHVRQSAAHPPPPQQVSAVQCVQWFAEWTAESTEMGRLSLEWETTAPLVPVR